MIIKQIKKLLRILLPQRLIVAINRLRKFPGSSDYWEHRYATGGDSGAGSYNRLAQFKASVLNEFVASHNIQTVMEFGCGDGNQLTMASYPKYIGFDVSSQAIKLCRERFKDDATKTFFTVNEYSCSAHKAELVLSLDVIYHLVEDAVFEEYIKTLFQTAAKFIIIYADNRDGEANYHVKTRNFTKYIEEKSYQYDLIEHIPNKYPYSRFDPDNTSGADFYIYKNRKNTA